jgi:membrane protease YdiL (CAAX protease family)
MHIGSGSSGTLAFFVLACGITWLLGLPLSLAWLEQRQPAGYAMALAGLSAFGPTWAAIILALRRRELREVWGRWRTHPLWVALGLFVPMALHLPATALEVALGGQPSHWFYPPVLPEHFAALVLFSIGEELGWHGFAYPRLVKSHGPIRGALILGSVWGLWHLVMFVTPDGTFSLLGFGLFILELALWSVVIAALFERTNRSMALAIAIHMGAHLDNVSRAPETETRLRILRFAVLVVAAGFAARSLTARTRATPLASLSASA